MGDWRAYPYHAGIHLKIKCAQLDGRYHDADLEEVYNTERHLLYVACTRARDYLMVSGVAPESEFLDDLLIG